MATSVEELIVRIGGDTAQLRQALRSARGDLHSFGNDVKSLSDRLGLSVAQVNSMSVGLQKASTGMRNFGASGQAVMDISRILEDSAFGMRAISNNITPLIASMKNLTTTAGGLMAGLRGLAVAAFSPAGLLMLGAAAFSFALAKMGDTARRTKDEISALKNQMDLLSPDKVVFGLEDFTRAISLVDAEIMATRQMGGRLHGQMSQQDIERQIGQLQTVKGVLEEQRNELEKQIMATERLRRARSMTFDPSNIPFKTGHDIPEFFPSAPPILPGFTDQFGTSPLDLGDMQDPGKFIEPFVPQPDQILEAGNMLALFEELERIGREAINKRSVAEIFAADAVREFSDSLAYSINLFNRLERQISRASAEVGILDLEEQEKALREAFAAGEIGAERYEAQLRLINAQQKDLRQSLNPFIAGIRALEDAVNSLIQRLIQAAIEAAIVKAIMTAIGGEAGGEMSYMTIFGNILSGKGSGLSFGGGGGAPPQSVSGGVAPLQSTVSIIRGTEIQYIDSRVTASRIRQGLPI